MFYTSRYRVPNEVMQNLFQSLPTRH